MNRLGAIRSTGTKTAFWPVIIANSGTLICLLSGRRNPLASAFGLGLAALGILLILRYAINRRRGRNHPTKVV